MFLRILKFVIIGILLVASSPLYSEQLGIGSDRRTDGVTLSFQSATQFTDLFTGSASYSIPINLPMGPGGLTPSLGLSYSSDSGNGWFGQGWGLTGLSKIERSTKYGIPNYADGTCGEKFNPDQFDRFELNLNGSHYQILWDTSSKSYVTNPDGAFKIEYTCDTTVKNWKITDKSGIKYEFKGIPAVGRDGFHAYPVSKVEDLNGNKIIYDYCIDKVEGGWYPARISYGTVSYGTGFRQTPTCKDGLSIFPQKKIVAPPVIRAPINVIVDFELEERIVQNRATERLIDYKSGASMVFDKRIKSISLKSTHGGVWQKIAFEYNATKSSARTLLSKVSILGKKNGGESLDYEFAYQGQESHPIGFEQIVDDGVSVTPKTSTPNLWPLLSARSTSNQVTGELYPGVRWVDLNGDALTDMAWSLANRGQKPWEGSAIVSAISIADKPLSWTSIEQALHRYSPADSILNLHQVAANVLTTPFALWPKKPCTDTVAGYGGVVCMNMGAFAGTQFVDVNKDGFLDIVHSFDYGNVTSVATWLNLKGKGWKLDAGWALPEKYATYKGALAGSIIHNIKLVDVNGDGYPDIVDAKKGAYLNKGYRGRKGWETFTDKRWKLPSVDNEVPQFGFFYGPENRYVDKGYRYLDLNGDGLQDLLISGVDNNEEESDCFREAWLNTGHWNESTHSAYVEAPEWKMPRTEDNPCQLILGTAFKNAHLSTQLIDINNDGLPDIVHSPQNSAKVVFYNSGYGWTQSLQGSDWLLKIPNFSVSTLNQAGESVYKDNGVSFADFNGDCALDIGRSVFRYTGMPKAWEYNLLDKHVGVWINRFKPPLLTTVKTPLGGRVAFEYQSSHENGNHSAHQDEQGINHLPFPKQGVAAISVDDGVNPLIRTEFSYKSGKYDFTAREFRGFRTVHMRPAGAFHAVEKVAETVYTFFQDSSKKGRLSSIRIGDNKVFSEKFFAYNTTIVGSDVHGKAYRTLLEEETVINYDGIKVSSDLLVDLNFDVGQIADDMLIRERSCEQLTYKPWTDTNIVSGLCTGGPTAVDYKDKSTSPTIVAFEPKDFPSQPFGGHAFNGRAQLSLGDNVGRTPLTIQTWFLPDSPGEGEQRIADFGGVGLYLDKNNRLLAKNTTNSVETYIQSNAIIPVGEFSHLSLVVNDKNTGELFVNGNLVAKSTEFGKVGSEAHTMLQIGSSPTHSIDGLKIFKAVVNTPKISKIRYMHDAYGNITESIDYGDLSTKRDDRVIHFSYDYRKDEHILDRASYVYIREGGVASNSKIKAAEWRVYDNLGQLSELIFWAGARGFREVPQKKDKNNPKMSFTYDDHGNPKRIVNPRGHATTLSYSKQFPVKPEIVTNPLDHQTHIAYYGISYTEEKEKFSLGLFGQVKSVTDANNANQRFVYDHLGRVRAIYGPTDTYDLYPGVLFSYGTYDAPSRNGKNTIRLPWQRVAYRTRILPEKLGGKAVLGELKNDLESLAVNQSSSFDLNYLIAGDWPYKKGSVSTAQFFFDGFGGNVIDISEVDPEKKIARVGAAVKVDIFGREESVYRPKFLSDAEYSDFGHIRNEKYLDQYFPKNRHSGPHSTIIYDAVGRVIRVTSPDGTEYKYIYDRWMVSEIDPNNHRKDYFYDARGQLEKIKEHCGRYDSDGPLLSLADLGKPNLLDPTGLKESVMQQHAHTSAKSEDCSIEVTYEYDILGNIKKIIDPERNEIVMEYDSLSRLIKMSHPDMGAKKGLYWKYQYDKNNNITEIIDPKAQAIVLEFDELDRIEKKIFFTTKQIFKRDHNSKQGGELITLRNEAQIPVIFHYDNTSIGGNDAIGKLVRMTDSSGKTDLRYNLEGEIEEVKKTIGGTTYKINIEYDKLGRVSTLTYPDSERVEYIYGRDGHLTEVKGNAVYARNMLYDAIGRLRRITYGNGLETRYDFDDGEKGNQRLKTIKMGKFQNIPSKKLHGRWIGEKEFKQLLLDLEYDYDPKGNVAIRKNKTAGDVESYKYDEWDRLIENDRNGRVETYQYDHLGNLLKAGAIVLDYDKSGWAGPHAVTKITKPTATNGKQSTIYKYDANGNLEKAMAPDNTQTVYKYSVENWLQAVNDESTYVYDGSGARDVVNENGVKRSYVAGLMEVGVDNKTKYYFNAGGMLAYSKENSDGAKAIGFVHTDYLGNLALLTSEGGGEIARRNYKPFGKDIVKTKEKAPIPIGFGGNELDSSGLYFFGARYYDPEIFHFINVDPLFGHFPIASAGDSQLINPYSIAKNNPITYVDYFGLETCEDRCTFEDEVVTGDVTRLNFEDHHVVVNQADRTTQDNIILDFFKTADWGPGISAISSGLLIKVGDKMARRSTYEGTTKYLKKTPKLGRIGPPTWFGALGVIGRPIELINILQTEKARNLARNGDGLTLRERRNQTARGMATVSKEAYDINNKYKFSAGTLIGAIFGFNPLEGLRDSEINRIIEKRRDFFLYVYPNYRHPMMFPQ